MKRFLILICCVFVFSNVGDANAELFTMVYDRYNDIFWTQDLDTTGEAVIQDFYNANAWVQGLETGEMQDWMLPTVDQVASLYADNGLMYTNYPFTMNDQDTNIIWAVENAGSSQYIYYDQAKPYGEIDDNGHSWIPGDPDYDNNSFSFAVHSGFGAPTGVVSGLDILIYDSINDIFWTQARELTGEAIHMNWTQTDAWVQGLETGAMQDWMLPSIEQLASLYEDNGLTHLNRPFQMGTQWNIVWSAEMDDTNAFTYAYIDSDTDGVINDVFNWYTSKDDYNDGTNAKRYSFAVHSPISEPIPEPTTMLLLGTGLIGLAGVRRRLKK